MSIPVGFVVHISLLTKRWCIAIEGDHHPLGVHGTRMLQEALQEPMSHASWDLGDCAEAFSISSESIVAPESQGVSIHQQKQWCSSGLGLLLCSLDTCLAYDDLA